MGIRKLSLLVCSWIVLFAVCANATERQSNADYHARRVALAKQLDGGTLVLFAPTEAEGPNNLYGFRQEDNFFYLTGWWEPGAAVLINANPYTEILFLAEHNVTQEKWTGPKLGPEDPQAPQKTGFDKVESLDKLHAELLRLLPQPRATVYSDLGANGQTTPSTGPLEWLRRGNSFPNYVSFRDGKNLIARLRMVKDAGELKMMSRASDASVAAHLAALKAIHPGV
ncbi:MAG TPA: aminopeptidase P N-terminal domain-containing protein, partial [Candidatus Angelobacter sp.]|nr:aminopeptidase P N-terminal domain-containing protein [Candidatus Angelobacter sp.]